MNNLLADLHTYLTPLEYVILLLGIVAFVLFLFLFTYQILKGKKSWNTMLLAIVSFCFVGFPVIKKIQVNKDGIAIETINDKIERGDHVSEDEKKKLALTATSLNMSKRDLPSKEKLEIARAYKNLKKYDKAEDVLNKVTDENVIDEKARLAQQITAMKQVDRFTTNPNTRLIQGINRTEGIVAKLNYRDLKAMESSLEVDSFNVAINPDVRELQWKVRQELIVRDNNKVASSTHGN